MEQGAVSLTRGADLVARAAALMGERDRLVREVILALGEAARAGVVESLEHMPVDLWLAVGHKMTSAERSMLLDAADVLASMPALDQWWARGIVSWSVVRDVVGQVRRLGREGRGLVDARLAASGELLADMDPDQVCWAVADAVEAVRGATAKTSEEQAESRASFLAFQMQLTGGSTVFGQLDAVQTAVVTGALDEATALRDQHGEESDQQGNGARSAAEGVRGRRRSRAKDRAASLVELCGGTPGMAAGAGWSDPSDPASSADHGRDGLRAGRRPLVVVHVPLDRITETAAGLLEVAVPGHLPRLSAAVVENLLGDADVRAVLFDGRRPLHVTHRTHATRMHPDTRLAVTARDLGARDPGGRTPVRLSHVHHLTPGLHDPDRLVTVSLDSLTASDEPARTNPSATSNRSGRRQPATGGGHLRIIHRHGWTGHVDPPTGAVTWTHGHRDSADGRPDRVIRTLPWATPLNTPAATPTAGNDAAQRRSRERQRA